MRILADNRATTDPTQRQSDPMFGRFFMCQIIKPDIALASDTFGPLQQLFMIIPQLKASTLSMILKQQKELFDFLSHRWTRDLELADQIERIDDLRALSNRPSSVEFSG
jgi:hypothetical protein